MKCLALPLILASAVWVQAFKDRPNSVPGIPCSVAGVSGNCVTPDSEGHDVACNKVDGFFVVADGVCPEGVTDFL